MSGAMAPRSTSYEARAQVHSRRRCRQRSLLPGRVVLQEPDPLLDLSERVVAPAVRALVRRELDGPARGLERVARRLRVLVRALLVVGRMLEVPDPPFRGLQ